MNAATKLDVGSISGGCSGHFFLMIDCLVSLELGAVEEARLARSAENFEDLMDASMIPYG